MNDDKIKELQTKMDEMQRQLDELKKTKTQTRWRAGIGNNYTYLDSFFAVTKSEEFAHDIDDRRYGKGNYFPFELRDHLESETVMQIRFIQQMTTICWQIEPKRMGKAYAMGKNHDLCDYADRRFRDGKWYLLGIFNFSTQELANQAWDMLSDDLKEWLQK